MTNNKLMKVFTSLLPHFRRYITADDTKYGLCGPNVPDAADRMDDARNEILTILSKLECK